MDNIIVQNAKIIYRNFEGREGKYNAKGRRNFSVVFDLDTAQRLLEEGWNVRIRPSRDEDEPDTALMEVAVSFQNIPPKIFMVSGGFPVPLTEETVQILDWADIVLVDLAIRPYEWAVNGKSGVKAYLDTMYVTIREYEFEAKYRNMAPVDTPEE